MVSRRVRIYPWASLTRESFAAKAAENIPAVTAKKGKAPSRSLRELFSTKAKEEVDPVCKG
jgi:hypothetical protein